MSSSLLQLNYLCSDRVNLSLSIFEELEINVEPGYLGDANWLLQIPKIYLRLANALWSDALKRTFDVVAEGTNLTVVTAYSLMQKL